jgi:hypothetical protein
LFARVLLAPIAEGTITSASTLSIGSAIARAAAVRHREDAFNGFSSVTTTAGRACSHSRANAAIGLEPPAVRITKPILRRSSLALVSIKPSSMKV